MGELNKRIIIVGMAVVAMALAVIVKMCYISFAHGSEIREAVDDKAYGTQVVTAFGGNLLGDNSSDLLAYYYPSSDIRWNARTAKKNIQGLSLDTLKLLARKLDSKYLDKNEGRSYYPLFEKAFNKNLTNQLIVRDAREEEVADIRTYMILREPRGGLMIDEHIEMRFTSNGIGNRTLGKRTLDESDIHNVGIIGTYRDTLMGISMATEVFHGARMPVDVSGDLFPDEGCDVVTTINYDISEIAYNALYAQLQRVEGGKGCAIVMDVETGDVKAMINLERIAKSDRYSEQTNIACGHAYQPGSVFKLASFVVALKDGLIELDTEMSIGKGRMSFPGKEVIDSHTYREEQVWSMKKLFAQSSNVGAAKMVYDNYKNNPQKFVDGLHALHIDDHIKTDILTSARSVVKNTDSKNWWRTSLFQMAQGYEVMITPINLATFYNAIANNGVMMRPRYVKALIDKEYDETTILNPVVIDTICSKEVAQKAQEMMREVVVSGTARYAFKDTPYTSGGKTGTAQMAAKKGEYSATYICYFPAEKPKYTIYVMLTELYKEYYASTVAAPVARKIADQIYKIDSSFYKHITIDSKTPSVWTLLETIK